MDSILERFSDNLTDVKYITNPAVARDDEIKKLILVLLTPEKSAVLVGKPGIGKTAIVEGLAYRIQRGEVPEALLGYTIYRINTTALLTNNGEENRVLKLINELKEKEKVILFTSYQKMFEILEKDIPARFGIPVKKINGSTSVEKRQIIIDEFTEYEGSALLILNPRAAGTGLNITAANHVIHYNLEWNPALEDQASARAYRRGQTKNVFIYRLFYENTIEQIVNERIEKKREMSDVAVVGTEGEQNKKDLIAALVISPTRKGE